MTRIFYRTACILTFACAFTGIARCSQATPIDSAMELVGLSAIVSPFPGTTWAATDVTGALTGTAGAPVTIGVESILMTPGNRGYITDTTFAMNWGFRALLGITAGATPGGELVGRGLLDNVVLPEAGPFNSSTGRGLSETLPGGVTTAMLLTNSTGGFLGSRNITIDNKNVVIVNNAAAIFPGGGPVGGVFEPSASSAEMRFLLPAELGGGTLLASLAGTFTLQGVPEIDPATGSSAMALITGVLAMIEQRRRRGAASPSLTA